MSTFAIQAKSLATFDAADLQALVQQAVPESNLVEFKKEPPGGKWNTDQNLNDEARNGILKEIIAFSNSFGGTLFIGIDETSDEPKRASAVTAVPAVADLGARLQQSIHTSVDPQFPSIEIVPVVTDPTAGQGVLLVRVPPSAVAPHWNRPARRCYRRVGTNSMEIGMLDIQSLTLERAKISDLADEAFIHRRKLSFESLNALRSRNTQGVIGWHTDMEFPAGFLIRCTAAPTMPVRIGEPISERPDLRIGTEPVFLDPDRSSGLSSLSWYGGNEPNNFTPALREWRFSAPAGSSNSSHSQLVRMGGLIESRYIQCVSTNPNDLRAPILMPIEFVFTVVFSMLYQVEKFRAKTGYQGLAFEIELEVLTQGVVNVHYFHNLSQPGTLRMLEVQTIFPKYLVQSMDSFDALTRVIQHDVYNAMGRKLSSPGIDEVRLDSDRMSHYLAN